MKRLIRNSLRLSLIKIGITIIIGVQAISQIQAETSEVDRLVPKVHLKREVVIRGNLLKLGDLFSPVEQAEAPIAQAPALGEVRVLDSYWLADIAQKYGVDWKPVSRFEQVVVRRASRKISRSELEDVLRIALKEENIDHDDQIFIDNAPLEIQLASDEEPHIKIDQLNVNPQRTRFTALFVLRAGQSPPRTVKMSGRIIDTQSVPVLVRTLGPGDVISDNDIEWVTLRSALANNRVITTTDDLIGMSPRRRLRAGTPIRFGDLRLPVLISKGSLVNMVYQSTNMQLSATGRALENASKGQTVRVLNTHSRRVVHARADAPDQVSVLPSKVDQLHLKAVP